MQTVMETPQPAFVLRGHLDAVHAVDFVGSSHLLSASADGTVKIWKLDSQRAVDSFAASSAPIQSIHSLSTGQFVTSDREGLIKIWSADRGGTSRTPSTELRSDCQHFCNIDYQQADGEPVNVLASADSFSAALLWDLRTGSLPTGTLVHPDGAGRACSAGMLTSLVLHSAPPQQHLLSCGYEDGSILTYDLRTSKLLSLLKKHAEPVFALGHVPGAGCLLSGGGDALICQTPQAQLLDLDHSNGATVALPVAGVSSLSGRSDGRIWASGQWDHTVRLFQTKGCKPLAVLRHHRESVQAVRFSRCGVGCTPDEVSLLASASKDRTIAIWRMLANTVKMPS